MTGGWEVGGDVDHMVLLLRGGPPLILREPQHERPRPWGWLHGIGALTARGLGMTGGWEVGGGGDHMVLLLRGGPPLILREPQHERPRPWGWLHGIGALTTRGLGMAGGWGGGGEAITRDCTYAGTPPLILREPQHERPHPWGWLHGIGALTARGLGMTGGWEVGGDVDHAVLFLCGHPPAHTSRASRLGGSSTARAALPGPWIPDRSRE